MAFLSDAAGLLNLLFLLYFYANNSDSSILSDVVLEKKSNVLETNMKVFFLILNIVPITSGFNFTNDFYSFA